MSKSKQVIVGLLGLILLLLSYGVFTIIRANAIEMRLDRLEASYKQLRERHQTFVSTMLHADDSPYATVLAKAELLRESLDLPGASIVKTRPMVTELNSPPQGASTK